MDHIKKEMNVREVRARMLRIRKRDLESRLQTAELNKRRVEARIQQLTGERESLDMQIGGLKAQILEIDRDI